VEKHIGSIFQKLELEDEEIVSRRVAAVLLYLTDADNKPTRSEVATDRPNQP
jgi:hypothetical protein